MAQAKKVEKENNRGLANRGYGVKGERKPRKTLPTREVQKIGEQRK